MKQRFIVLKVEIRIFVKLINISEWKKKNRISLDLSNHLQLLAAPEAGTETIFSFGRNVSGASPYYEYECFSYRRRFSYALVGGANQSSIVASSGIASIHIALFQYLNIRIIIILKIIKIKWKILFCTSIDENWR